LHGPFRAAAFIAEKKTKDRHPQGPRGSAAGCPDAERESSPGSRATRRLAAAICGGKLAPGFAIAFRRGYAALLAGRFS